MLVFKMENGGHKLRSKASLPKLGKTKQKIPLRASGKALALSILMLVHWDPCWTSDFQNCEIIDLWCLNLYVCGNVLQQQSELNIHVYHYLFLKAPSTLDSTLHLHPHSWWPYPDCGFKIISKFISPSGCHFLELWTHLSNSLSVRYLGVQQTSQT